MKIITASNLPKLGSDAARDGAENEGCPPGWGRPPAPMEPAESAGEANIDPCGVPNALVTEEDGVPYPVDPVEDDEGKGDPNILVGAGLGVGSGLCPTCANGSAFPGGFWNKFEVPLPWDAANGFCGDCPTKLSASPSRSISEMYQIHSSIYTILN